MFHRHPSFSASSFRNQMTFSTGCWHSFPTPRAIDHSFTWAPFLFLFFSRWSRHDLIAVNFASNPLRTFYGVRLLNIHCSLLFFLFLPDCLKFRLMSTILFRICYYFRLRQTLLHVSAMCLIWIASNSCKKQLR